MRKKDEAVIKKIVDKIIDSNVLLTGDGDFWVEAESNRIRKINIRNLFSKESSIGEIQIDVSGNCVYSKISTYKEAVKVFPKFYHLCIIKKIEFDGSYRILFSARGSDLVNSTSFNRLAEYIEENEHLILHNDKEYGKSHTLTDEDFI